MTQVPQGAAPASTQAKGKMNGMALAGMIVGIAGVVTICLAPLAIILGAVAIILSIVGLKAAKKTGRGRGMAITGLILGALAVVVAVVLVAGFFAAKDTIEGQIEEGMREIQEQAPTTPAVPPTPPETPSERGGFGSWLRCPVPVLMGRLPAF